MSSKQEFKTKATSHVTEEEQKDVTKKVKPQKFAKKQAQKVEKSIEEITSSFQPGGYAPLFETNQVFRSKSANLIVLDPAGLDEFTQRTLTHVTSRLTIARPGHRYTQAAMLRDFRAMGFVATAIKLAHSCAETYPGWFATSGSFFRRLTLPIPDVIYRMTAALGEVNHFGTVYKIAGLPMLVESFFIKAVHPAGGGVAANVAAETRYVNTATVGFNRYMREYDEAVIHAWLQIDKPRMQIPGAGNLQVDIPSNPSDWALWKTMLHPTYPRLNNQPGGPDLPEHVEFAIKALAIYGGLGEIAVGVQAQLEPFGYRFVNWNSSTSQDHWNIFSSNYSTFLEALPAILKINLAEKVDPIGDICQTATASEDGVFIAPVSLAAKQREIVVASGMRNAVVVNVDHFMVTSGDAPGHAQDRWMSAAFN